MSIDGILQIRKDWLIINIGENLMYENMQVRESAWEKIRRSSYLIATISLLTHTMSITYSMMTFKQLSAGFISIVTSSFVCFFLSNSHLTIYGISILGILYLKMLEPYYSRSQVHYIVGLSGIIMFPFWKGAMYVRMIFQSFPGRIHASMVFGTALIALVKFFPLSIENIKAFFVSANQSALTNPLNIIILTFQNFNVLTLIITVGCIIGLFLLRNKLHKIPLIAVLVILGIIVNFKHTFLDYDDLCLYPEVDCKFYIIKISNIIPPALEKIIMLVPSAAVMTVVVVFQQFLYLQEFERRGKRYFGEGNLGETEQQSKVLGLANIISGFLGGLPICISLFATYENFSFNVKTGDKGTKLVGLMQVPVSYALYSILRFLFQMIPLFVLFVIVATPIIYFLGNMLSIHYRHIAFISCLAALNVLTHPIIALILAAFVSIYDISTLLKSTPAEILLENVDVEGQRRSMLISEVASKKSKRETEHQHQSTEVISEFQKRVIHIETDQPNCNGFESYVLYRFTGAVSYLNYFQHIKQITSLIQIFIKKQKKVPLLLSFRYSQIIDDESLEQLALFVERLKLQEEINVVFTGLHSKLIAKMEELRFFGEMLRKDDKSMFRLDAPEDQS